MLRVIARLLGASLVLAPFAFAASVDPTFFEVTANVPCSELGNPAWSELKVDPPAEGTFVDGALTVVVSNLVLDDEGQAKIFDWTSNLPVDAVYVKAGKGGSYLYEYDPASTGDTVLTSPGLNKNAISHISFCWIDDGGGTILSYPDAGIDKVALDAEIDQGDTIAFALLAESYGTAPATDVVVTDALPDVAGGWTFSAPEDGDCGIVDGTLTCTFASIDPGDSRLVIVAAATGSGDCGWITNGASIAATGDTNPDEDEAEASVYVRCADVSVDKSSAEAVDVGLDASFTITVTSEGPDDASGVVLTDSLPWLAGGWSWDDPACGLDNGTLTCAFGDMPAGDSRTVSLWGPTGLDDCGDLENSAWATADLDVDAANDADAATLHVTCADVSAGKSATSALVRPFQQAGFTLTLTSNGPDPAPEATLTDTLPWTYNGWTVGGPDAASCTLAGLALTCSFGTVPVGETRTVTVTTTASGWECGWVWNNMTTSARVNIDGTNDAAGASYETRCTPPRTQGYWKNHAELWPVSGLQVGDEWYTASEIMTLFNKPTKGDASMILAHQLFAARLNYWNGSPAQITPVMVAAETALTPYAGKLPYGVKTTSPAGAHMVALAAQLDAFNNSGG